MDDEFASVFGAPGNGEQDIAHRSVSCPGFVDSVADILLRVRRPVCAVAHDAS